MKIQDIIKTSGDSYLEKYLYENGQANLWMELDELDTRVVLRIESNLLALKVPESKDIAYRTCFLELARLTDVLSVKNGIYVPSKDFGRMMQEKRQNLNLAYGLREKDAEFIFSLSANVKLASFVIKNVESIDFEILDSQD